MQLKTRRPSRHLGKRTDKTIIDFWRRKQEKETTAQNKHQLLLQNMELEYSKQPPVEIKASRSQISCVGQLRPSCCRSDAPGEAGPVPKWRPGRRPPATMRRILPHLHLSANCYKNYPLHCATAQSFFQHKSNQPRIFLSHNDHCSDHLSDEYKQNKQNNIYRLVRGVRAEKATNPGVNLREDPVHRSVRPLRALSGFFPCIVGLVGASLGKADLVLESTFHFCGI